ncbi:Potassium channel subfamily K member 16 2P domain potassium channel [Triplophysa tibetana]|uniref:Potassium channel subfamily K member 16 2P domain potassium channel n=1 Tax=Triplophysa tibetana TaxID=1572043 RepID=A0A5A9NNB2_9TELE|nr:Potassium channel subfamily K member 16 2P domain potassium channel [Triplophysa tibetana]
MLPIFHGKLSEFLRKARFPSILLLGCLYLAYVLIGGLIFWKLEGGNVIQQIEILKEKRTKLLAKYSCLGQNGLREIAQMVKSASTSGLSPDTNNITDGFWKFTSSSVFAATVVTTIGYGNIIPQTAAGQIFCVFFAVFGIPLNIVILNKVGKYMLAIEKMFCNFLEKKIDRGKCVRISFHSMSFLISAFLYFMVPMLLFKEYEGWTYSEAIYYCFITLSTVGFGDYVAGKYINNIQYRVLCNLKCTCINTAKNTCAERCSDLYRELRISGYAKSMAEEHICNDPVLHLTVITPHTNKFYFLRQKISVSNIFAFS